MAKSTWLESKTTKWTVTIFPLSTRSIAAFLLQEKRPTATFWPSSTSRIFQSPPSLINLWKDESDVKGHSSRSWIWCCVRLPVLPLPPFCRSLLTPENDATTTLVGAKKKSGSLLSLPKPLPQEVASVGCRPPRETELSWRCQESPMVIYGPIDSPTRKMQNATNFDTQSILLIHNHLHLLIVDTETMTCHVPRAENTQKKHQKQDREAPQPNDFPLRGLLMCLSATVPMLAGNTGSSFPL